MNNQDINQDMLDEQSRLRRGDCGVVSPPMSSRQNCRAFSRIELLSICAALGLLALLVAPTLAANKTDSERLLCFNNLRLIGRAVHMWGGDHEQQTPWRTPVADGGLLPASGARPGNAFFEFAFLSNQLVTPKILACPSDAGVRRAADFVEFGALGYRNNAVSYVLGLESVGNSANSWVSGDRNLGGVPGGSGCSSRVNNVNGIISPLNNSPNIAWTNGVVHSEFGHILLMDGSVEFTSTPRLRALFLSPQVNDNGSAHFLKPR